MDWVKYPRLGAGLVVWGLLGGLGCSAPEIDKRDELAGGPEADEYEWVIVEANGGEADEQAKKDGASRGNSAAEALADPDTAAPAMAPQDMPPASGRPIRYDAEGDYTVQLAGYKAKSLAEEQVEDLQEEGYPAYSVRSPDGSKYRVRIGYFSSRADAELLGALFKEDRGMDYWVDRRSKE